MKELSIEEKAKRYDEIIKLVNSKWLYKNQPCVIDISEIFPELKEKITEYCCILDHSTGEVFKHCITEDEVDLTTEELLKKYGFKEDECSIMYTSNNLELKLLEN